MNGKEIYKIYAPESVKWTEWVRPVPFVAIDSNNRHLVDNWVNRKIVFIDNYENNTAIFIDLPGKESIELGISLAQIGYRPIPVFNGTNPQKNITSILDNSHLESALINGAIKLKNINLAPNANPVFLLDSYRTNRYREKESIFDNSWDIYNQDVPTADYLKANGIDKIILVSNDVQHDLKKIFLKFQENGIKFYLTNGYSEAKEITLRKTFKEFFEKEEL